jgi:hypothetical protein
LNAGVLLAPGPGRDVAMVIGGPAHDRIGAGHVVPVGIVLALLSTFPFRSLNMATPVSVFRPAPASEPPPAPAAVRASSTPAAAAPRLPVPRRQQPGPAQEAVEFDMVITPSGRLCLPGNQQIKFTAAPGLPRSYRAPVGAVLSYLAGASALRLARTGAMSRPARLSRR